jgi:hypothetical protein
LIGADGLRSQTRNWLGIEAPFTSLRRYGAVQHYAIKPWSRKVEIHWRSGLEIYITPCGTDEIGIGFLWDKNLYTPPALGKNLAEGFLVNFPKVQERLHDIPKLGPA